MVCARPVQQLQDLQSLAAPTPTDLPVGLDEQFTLLLDWLRRHRCLLILDNLESLLDGDGRDRLRKGYGRSSMSSVHVAVFVSLFLPPC